MLQPSSHSSELSLGEIDPAIDPDVLLEGRDYELAADGYRDMLEKESDPRKRGALLYKLGLCFYLPTDFIQHHIPERSVSPSEKEHLAKALDYLLRAQKSYLESVEGDSPEEVADELASIEHIISIIYEALGPDHTSEVQPTTQEMSAQEKSERMKLILAHYASKDAA